MARPKKQRSRYDRYGGKEAVIARIRNTGGDVSAVSRLCGCARQSVSRWLNDDEEIAREVEQARSARRAAPPSLRRDDYPRVLPSVMLPPHESGAREKFIKKNIIRYEKALIRSLGDLELSASFLGLTKNELAVDVASTPQLKERMEELAAATREIARDRINRSARGDSAMSSVELQSCKLLLQEAGELTERKEITMKGSVSYEGMPDAGDLRKAEPPDFLKLVAEDQE